MNKYQYTMTEIEAQMARRIAYQLNKLDDSERSYKQMAKSGFRTIPRNWLVIAEDWCKDHHINHIHGALALLHFKVMFGTGFGDVELRIILDCAFERARNNNWYL